MTQTFTHTVTHTSTHTHPTTASLLPLLYAGDERYGWSAGMRAITHALLDAVVLPEGPVTEVGFGGGQLLLELQQRYPTRAVMGIDPNPLALLQAQQLVPSTVDLCQAALPTLPWPTATLALVVALDVFDQRGVVLAAALAESYRVLVPGGALVLRLSAHPRLYGAHDIAFHTGQRYTRQQLYKALTAAGFVVQRLTYANSLLSLPVAAVRLAQRWGALAWQAESYEHRLLHRLAASCLRGEAKWLRHADLPWGISLCAVARKS